jgi:hypothetical protein
MIGIGDIVKHQQRRIASGLKQAPHPRENGGVVVALPAQVERVSQFAQSRRDRVGRLAGDPRDQPPFSDPSPRIGSDQLGLADPPLPGDRTHHGQRAGFGEPGQLVNLLPALKMLRFPRHRPHHDLPGAGRHSRRRHRGGVNRLPASPPGQRQGDQRTGKCGYTERVPGIYGQEPSTDPPRQREYARARRECDHPFPCTPHVRPTPRKLTPSSVAPLRVSNDSQPSEWLGKPRIRSTRCRRDVRADRLRRLQHQVQPLKEVQGTSIVGDNPEDPDTAKGPGARWLASADPCHVWPRAGVEMLHDAYE